MYDGNRFAIEIPSFANGDMMPASFAFGVAHPEKKVVFSTNRNPHIEWRNVPENTVSLVLLMVDLDAPVDLSCANQVSRVIKNDAERGLFYHWVLVNISPQICDIPAGSVSDGVQPGGKLAGVSPYGMLGLNDYTKWFSEDADMQGNYGGYDGPCPPWNDNKIHRYAFQLYALDTKLIFKGDFTGHQVKDAIAGHIIDQDEWLTMYTLNQTLWQPAAI